MRLINLNNQLERQATIDADVCVVGAGAAGIYFSSISSNHFKNLVVLEAGEINSVFSEKFFSSAMFNNEVYSGAISGRAFGVGGTTSLWGGLLAPYGDVDVKNENGQSCAWRTIINSIRNNTGLVLKNLGFHSKHQFDILTVPNFLLKFLNDAGICLISSLTIPFSKRNFCWMLGEGELKKSSTLFFYNSVVVDSEFITSSNDDIKIQNIEAVSENGNRIIVRAKKVLIANGAIESTRLLLEFQERARKSGFCPPETDLGLYFSDHISASIASFEYSKTSALIKLFFPIFCKNWMKSFRFILKDGHKHPRHFFYLQVLSDGRGLRVIRSILQYFQTGILGKIDKQDFLFGGIQIIKFGFNRYFNKRLYVEEGSQINIQLDVEQSASSQNCIFLSNHDLDDFGRKKIYIQWKISDYDILKLKELSAKIVNDWNSLPSIFPKLTKIDGGFDGGRPYDIYHPSGSCRMGSDLRSVVDNETLKVRGYDNVYLLSTSLFPSAGSSNPTFSLLCIAHSILFKMVLDVKD
jgi:hypothetical protein